jgi:enolase-phosphatase E1
VDLNYLDHCTSVYDDVLTAFERWTNTGIKISIYSSGSVQAQKLLFSYSKFGDLTKVFLLQFGLVFDEFHSYQYFPVSLQPL